MRFDFSALSWDQCKSGGTGGTGGTASADGALERSTTSQNRWNKVEQRQATGRESREVFHLFHRTEKPVERRKPCSDAVVPPVPPVPPAKSSTEIAAAFHPCGSNDDAFGSAIDREAFEERAAVMEFDGGLSRDEAEVCVWLDLIGERTPEIIAEVLTACRRDPDARAYFLRRAAGAPY